MIDDAANTVDGRPIPDLDRLHNLKFPRVPRLDAMCFLHEPNSRIPEAGVCLNDSYSMIAEARYALLEGFRLMQHYRAKDPPNEGTVTFMGQFYGADVALRLYSGGEHLANAIVELLEIDRRALEPYKQGRVSLQGTLARFLASERSSHPLSRSVLELGASADWKWIMEYRSDWVHEQPAQVTGPCMIFKRGEQYWRAVTDREGTSYEIGIGGGAEPDLSVDELLESARAASCRFTDTLVLVAEQYVETVKSAPRRVPVRE